MKNSVVILIILLSNSCVCFETTHAYKYEIENNTDQTIVIHFIYGSNFNLDSLVIGANSKTEVMDASWGRQETLDCSDAFFENGISYEISNGYELTKYLHVQENWEHTFDLQRCSSAGECIFVITDDDLIK